MSRAIENAVVTGAGGGIGRELCFELARRGARVLCADIDEAAAEDTAARVAAAGGEGWFARCDVGAAAEVEALAERAESELGAVDLLVNNAGVMVISEVAGTSLAEYRQLMDVNLWGVIHGCHYFVPPMVARGRGRVLNVASLAGVLPLPYMGAYAATKAAVIALSETLAAELSSAGVSVTVLCPSFTRTRLFEVAGGEADEAAWRTADAIMGALGADPARVARRALEATLRGRIYAVPVLHGRVVWGLKRLAPRAAGRGLGIAYRLLGRRRR